MCERGIEPPTSTRLFWKMVIPNLKYQLGREEGERGREREREKEREREREREEGGGGGEGKRKVCKSVKGREMRERDR